MTTTIDFIDHLTTILRDGDRQVTSTHATRRAAMVYVCVERFRAAGWDVRGPASSDTFRLPLLLPGEKLMTKLDGSLVDKRAQGFTAGRVRGGALFSVDACAGLPVFVTVDEGDTKEAWSILMSVFKSASPARVPYTLFDLTEGGERMEITATGDDDAEAQARDWVLNGDWDLSCGTIWIDVKIQGRDGESWTITVSIDPESACTEEDGHDWQAPLEILGGIRENPGVFSHGGGVVMTEVCSHCGTYQITDTWAQRSDTAEQGLRSVRYREADDESLAWVESVSEDSDGEGEEDGPRFWVDDDPCGTPNPMWVAVVDERAGGVIAFVRDEDMANLLISALTSEL